MFFAKGNAKMLELSFPFSRFADRNIEIFQSPFRHFQDLAILHDYGYRY
jgi:hypothetical protein